MKKIFISGWLVLVLAACRPVQKNLVVSGSYTEIGTQAEVPKINKMIAPYKTTLDAAMHIVIGYSDVAMPKERGVIESVLGNFTADAVMFYARQTEPAADITVLNNGGLRSSLPQGNINVGNIFELMPFDNEVTIVELKGETMIMLFDYIAKMGGVPVSGLNLQLVKDGEHTSWKNAMVQGKPFSKDQTYKVATSDYLVGGGDNMGFLSIHINRYNTGKKIRDVIIDYIMAETGKQHHLAPALDNRISW